ncbi:MAG TPA: hypothetical protein VFK69_06270, partial [Candidatus Eisenbacteria bacterium]|nr:hypothetical protein [Candidatus Eisenbacteria bacterium]
MFSCSGSSPRARLAAAALMLLGLALAAPAMARTRVHHRVIVHEQGPAKHVIIDQGGVTVVRADSAASDSFLEDEDSSESIVDVRGPHIRVDDGEGEGLVRVFSDADVPAGRHVEGDVVAVFGTVDVAGSVSGDVVSVCGSVHLRPGASVGGDVVSVGGALDRAPNATVGGQSVSIGFLPSAWGLPALPFMIGTVLVLWFITLIVAWLMQVLAPARVARITETAARQFVGSFFLGVLSFPLSVLAMALLFVTVVGIPVALLWPIAYTLMLWGGLVIGSAVLGCGLLRRRPGEGGVVGPAALGGLMIGVILIAGAALAGPPGPTRTLALLFGLVGVLLAFGLSAVGAGAMLLSRGGREPVSGPAPFGAAVPPP